MKTCPHCQEDILEKAGTRYCRHGCDITTVHVPGHDFDDRDPSVEDLGDGGSFRVPTCQDE